MKKTIKKHATIKVAPEGLVHDSDVARAYKKMLDEFRHDAINASKFVAGGLGRKKSIACNTILPGAGWWVKST